MQKNTSETNEPKTFGQVVLGLHRAIETMSAGDRADLKRLRPGGLEPAAFWRLATGPLAAQFAHVGAERREALEGAWALVASAIARSGMPFDAKRSLGKALAESGISELRLLRLLRADPGQLPAQAHAIAQLLASKGQATHWIDFARLVISADRSDRETARRQIARDYFSSTNN